MLIRTLRVWSFKNHLWKFWEKDNILKSKIQNVVCHIQLYSLVDKDNLYNSVYMYVGVWKTSRFEIILNTNRKCKNSSKYFEQLIYLKVTSGGSRFAVTSRIQHFVIIVNIWKPLIIVTKRSILDVEATLDPPLVTSQVSNTFWYLK